MISDSKFDSIRPYVGSEVVAAAQRLSNAEAFLSVFSQLTQIDKNVIAATLKDIHTRDEFQSKFFGPAIQSVIDHTSDGVSISGLEISDRILPICLFLITEILFWILLY